MIRLNRIANIVDPYPAVLLRNSTLLIADLHLGFEEELEHAGVHIPYSPFREMLSMLDDIISETRAKKIGILGDIKHEFSARLYSEYEETTKLVDFLRSKGLEIFVVRGNHDNFIVPVLERLGVRVYHPLLKNDEVCLMHGHLDVDLKGCKFIVLGHEHPTVVLKDSVGVKHRFKAFLYGSLQGDVELLVIPAFNPLAQGTPINSVSREDLLSPVLRKYGVEDLDVYALDTGIKVVRLAKVWQLRRLLAASNNL